MSVPDYYRYVSLILSRVMDDIGLNEECVMRRRRSCMLQDNLWTLSSNLVRQPQTQHIIGSQSEGSTTRGLKSDTDILFSFNDWRVIQNWKDWSPGIYNHMMIQDETTFPGYCKLQVLRSDMPLLDDKCLDKPYVYDEKHRIVLKNDLFSSGYSVEERHGPALKLLNSRGVGCDNVLALFSQKWPKHCKQWSLRREARDWPTPEMVEYMETSGCFVVPVAHRCAERQDMEWRISTTLAERCLMFNLNFTQIRCYVILKMVNKTFIEPFVPDVISSYICKTLLFHTLERTSRDFWREENLLACVNLVFYRMLSAVYNMNCSNYFCESANLLFGKLDQESTRERLLVILRKLLHSQGGFLLQIGFDDINVRMKTYFLNEYVKVRYDENESERFLTCAKVTLEVCKEVVSAVCCILICTKFDHTITRDLHDITDDYSNKGSIQKRTASTLFPFLCSHIATVEMSKRIGHGQNVSPEELLLMYMDSLDSDVASSRLKFASSLYCTGHYTIALSVLQLTEQYMNSSAIQLCSCSFEARFNENEHGLLTQGRGNAYPSTSNVGLCVMFSQLESQCCPSEMRYEFFRSTDEDRLRRHKTFDAWMDLAVLDCLPFLYFLQYMTARQLGERALQYRALHKLTKSALREEDLGHRETALNVLGQCMEHENRFDEALQYYKMSLQHRPRNNAVRWHLPR